MNFLNPLKEFIQDLDDQRFYHYLIGLIAALVFVMGFMMVRYYTTTNSLRKKIANTNEVRETKVKKVLELAAQLQQAHKLVDETLAKDPNFKIQGYYLATIAKLGLQSISTSAEPSQVGRDKNYMESILKANFKNMNMKQLTELLQELEHNERISTKELEITKSPNSATINVNLTIGTLHLQAEAPE